MSQLEYTIDTNVAREGQPADANNLDLLTYRAAEDLKFGRGLVLGAADRDARLPLANVAVLSFDADFVTDNEISLEVNGELVEQSFDSDHATTLTALAAGIDALDDVSAEVTDDREITITGDNVAVDVENVEVTGGASQAEGSVDNQSNDQLVGITVTTHRIEQRLDQSAVAGQLSSGGALYREKDAANVLTKGRVYVRVEQDVNALDSVYVRFVVDGDDERGQFRADDASGDAIEFARARYVQGASEGELAVVEVNLP